MKLKFELTPADLQDGSWLRVRERKRLPRILLFGCGIILWTATVRSYLSTGHLNWTYALVGLVCFIWEDGLFRLLNIMHVSVFIRRNRRLYQAETEMEITPERLVVRQQGSVSEITWSTVQGVRVGPKTILLYLSKDFALCLPRRAFTEAASETECIGMLKTLGLKEM
jgi:hypothetical protein